MRTVLRTRPGESAAIVGLLVLTIVAEWDLVVGPTLLGMDTATAFYPWYAFLGQQLRNGHIPVWNPHQFAGSPFAADPESGWTYLPAMLAFTFLPLDVAARAHMFFHVLLAGLSTYALARTLGANRVGSLAAGTIYAHTGFFEGHNVCCFAYASVSAWLPLLLLGAEQSIRATTWRARGLWWGISGLAFSQILAVWVGQAAYYAALVLGAYIAYRTLLAPGAIRLRLTHMLVHGAGVLLFGFSLAAAGLLPRLEYNLLSNLPGGYPDDPASLPAQTGPSWGFLANWDRLLLDPGYHYLGWTVLGLAALGVLLGRRHTAMPYFAILPIAVLVLARYEPTPLHALFSFLPGFERIHARSPERAMLAFYLGPVILAGIGVSHLSFASVGGRRAIGTVAALLALGLIWTDLHLAWTAQAAESRAIEGAYKLEPASLADYYAPTGAARFLQAHAPSERSRYFGHAQHLFGGTVPYTLRWADPGIAALEVNNRALMNGLDDVQGYNPIHLARYDEFMAALNGTPQNYHHADVLGSGLSSPLLDLLGVRYVIVPSTTAQDQLEPRFTREVHVVYRDDLVQVLENPSALPRAWLVHHVEQVTSGQAVRLIASGAIDPRRTALLEDRPPALAQPTDSSADAVLVTRYDQDRMQLRTTSPTAGLLVLGEVYYPAWHAYVDGQPAPVYVADHALRAVAVPSGEHVIDMRYESMALTVGIILTVVATIGLAALGILARATT